MKVTSVSSSVLRIPLPAPTADANRQHSHRDYALVRVETDTGVEGWAYCLEGVMVDFAVRELLAPHVLGEDPFDSRRLWDKLFRVGLQTGRRGAVLRALSCIDIALWDIKGKVCGLPVYKLLGAHRDTVPAYASGGYYREGRTLDDLAAEMHDYVSRGFRAVKMKIGRQPPAEDAERVRIVRETIGNDVKLMVDANNAWASLPAALETVRRIEPYDIFWLEEPTLPDATRLSARIAESTSILVATGEIESTRWGFQNLIDHGAASILQPDVTVVGGITEFMRVADTAASRDIPIAPHYFWDLHAHLIAACPNGLFVEHFVHDDVVNFDLALKNPMEARDGELALPQTPGLGLELDEQKVAQFSLRRD